MSNGEKSKAASQAGAADTYFAQRVRERRELLEWSQTELAEALQAAGLSFQRQVVYKVESGQRPVRLGEAITIAEVLGISLDELVTGGGTVQDSQKLQQAHVAVTRSNELMREDAQQLMRSLYHYASVVGDVQSKHANDPLASELVEGHLSTVESCSPVWTLEAEAIAWGLKMIGKGYWSPQSTPQSPAASWHWSSCLTISRATRHQWRSDTDHPPGHWLKDLMRLAIFQDAMRAVEAMETGDQATLEALRGRGYEIPASAGGNDG